MEYVLDGKGTVSFDGGCFHIGKDDVYLLPPTADYDYFSNPDEPWDKIWFNIGGDLVNCLLDLYDCTVPRVICASELKVYFIRIIDYCKKYDSPDLITRNVALTFHEMLRHIYLNDYSGRVCRTRDALTLKDYIDSHIESDISLHGLSRVIDRCESQVLRIFRNAFDTTPYEYLLEQRLERAKILLVNTNMLIKDVARKVGFNDEHYFSLRFRQKFGMTPREFRNQ